MTKMEIAVWSEKGGAAYEHSLPAYFEHIGLDGPVAAVKDLYENVFAFLESERSEAFQTLVLEDALTKYTSESNYRRALALLFEKGKHGSIALISELLSSVGLPTIFRALRTLGVDQLVSVSQIGDRCLIRVERGRKLVEAGRWSDDRAPYVEQKDNATAIDVVIGAIQRRAPLSLIRVGHCEVRFLAHGYLYGDSDIDASAALQWGQAIDCAKARWIQNNLSRSIANADMLGYKNRTAFSSKPLKIFENSVSMCLANLSLLKPGQIQVDPNIHFALGKSAGFLEAISTTAKVVIISPRKELALRFSSLFANTTQVELLDLPGEFRIDGPSDVEDRFSRFLAIEDHVARLTGPGVVFLVGAGVAGKQYCEIARAGGGIGLDLGSTLDAWAGVDSRGGGFPDELKGAIEAFRANKG